MNEIRRAAWIAAALCIASAITWAQSRPALLADINLGASASAPARFQAANGVVYFFADDGVHGKELWSTDGTSQGTFMVRDLRVGPGSSFVGSGEAYRFAELGGFVYFVANDGITGAELYRTDGTPAGTQQVADANLGPIGSDPRWLTALPGAGGLLYSADGGAFGRELWTSDGTQAGTLLVRDIHPGALAFFPPNASDPEDLVVANGVCFFRATDSMSGRELWRSDGTTAGTILVTDIHPGTNFFSAPLDSTPSDLTVLSGFLFFSAEDGAHGRELWISSGTAATTTLLQDLTGDATGSNPEQLVTTNTGLFFTADDGAHGRELWTVSLASGLTFLGDANPFPGQSGATGPVVATSNGVVFAGTDGFTGNELFASDGTGVVRLTNLLATSTGLDVMNLTSAAGRAYFRGATAAPNGETWLFVSDGTIAGTRPLGEIGVASDPSIVGAGTLLFFAGNDGAGEEPWVFDTTKIPGAALPLTGGCGPTSTIPILAASPPVLGQAMLLTLSDLTPNAAGMLYFTVGGPDSLALGPCAVHLDLENFAPLLPFVTDGAGSWQLPLVLPGTPALAGFDLTLQAAIFGTAAPFGVDLSTGLWVVLGT